MNLNLDVIKSVATQKLGRTGLVLQKNSPHIFLGLGIAGIVAGTVILVKAGSKAEEVAKDTAANVEFVNNEVHPEEKKQAMVQVYAEATGKYVRIFAPGVLLSTAGLACVLYSHGIMTRRNAGLAAAIGLTSKAFDDYRARVVNQFGEEIDRNLRFGTTQESIKEKQVGEDGKTVTAKRSLNVIPGEAEVSGYARFFDEYSVYWKPDGETNLAFLRSQERFCNQKLEMQGHFFLNEALDALGIPRTKAGSVVGWLRDGMDGKISFGIYDVATHNNDAINGYEENFLLDFNVDGPIWNMI